MRKSVRMRIEDELRNYHATRRRYYGLRDELCFDREQPECYGRSNAPGDPTGSMAVKLASSPALLNMERWVKAMEAALCRLDKSQYRLIELRYWTTPRTLTNEGIAIELGIGRATLYRWVDAVLDLIDRNLGESFDQL